MTHRQRVSFCRWMLRKHTGSVAAAFQTGNNTETTGDGALAIVQNQCPDIASTYKLARASLATEPGSRPQGRGDACLTDLPQRLGAWQFTGRWATVALMSIERRPLRTADLEQAWQLDRQAFNTAADQRLRWCAKLDASRISGLFIDGRLVACAGALPFGQFFGRRSVPMGGVCSVAVALEHRGKGYAAQAVADQVAAMRQRGEAISALFPATSHLYRGLGWEIAGLFAWRKVPTRSLRLLTGGASVNIRRATIDDLPAIQRCYARVAPTINGFVDRPDSWWRWVFSPWNDFYGYVAEAGPEVSGYVIYRHEDRRPGEFYFRIIVHDLVASSADAAAALWRLVGSSASQVEEVIFRGAQEDPLLFSLGEQDDRTWGDLRWMLRIVDAVGAVAARGFPPGLRVTVEIELDDRLCEANRGPFALTVADGHGQLERGGKGNVRFRIGGFGSLYSGYASAYTLARVGLLSGGSPSELAALDAAFTGPTPWMLDEF
jgi:predicted acetyltransferase